MYGKSIENKTNSYNVILLKPFPGARIISLDLEKTPDLVIVHTDTNDIKSVSSPEEISNEIIPLALYVIENGHHIAVSGIVPRGERFSKKLRVLTNVWKYNVT